MIRAPQIDDDGSRSVGLIPGLTDDGREFIPMWFVVEYPWLAPFLLRFANYYVFDPYADCWFGPAAETMH